jgi:hypothetical protein
MKKAIVAGLVGLVSGAGLLVPQFAHAAGVTPPYPANCPTGVTQYVQNGGGSTQAAVCVGGLPTSAAGFTGGAVAAGATTSNGPNRLCSATPAGNTTTPLPTIPGAYVIVDGNDANTLSNSNGYIGVSNYESGGNSSCPTFGSATTPNDSGGNTNSGGYVGVKQVNGTPVGVYLPVPFVACGFTSGSYFGAAGRDGCAIP